MKKQQLFLISHLKTQPENSDMHIHILYCVWRALKQEEFLYYSVQV